MCLKSVIYRGGNILDELMNNEDFITEAVNTYSDMIYNIALHITCNSEDAFDVCQDVFLRLHKNKSKIKDNEHLKAWVLRTAINCARSYCTQGYRKNTVPIDDVPETEFAFTNKFDETINLVMRLPEKYRVVINLFYYQELSVEEIAEILNIKKSNVKTRLSRGRKFLEKIIREEESYE